ncbi:hypothetical protein [Chromobacterium sphagni]|uniref:Uncharacterized protein n=1 Tax=Chromobacterium sphagni TaxID=1903179 RepID=A0ABX3CBW6_9NEIS|nr:hypothetical protein [Chromobacterium sphagni]OHX19780.1 hypothetical protein BI344_16800 [Chromobacterium sphagni]
MTESPKANDDDWTGLNLPILTDVVEEPAVPVLAEEEPAAAVEIPEFDFSSELDVLAAELDDEAELEIPELTLADLLDGEQEAGPASTAELDFISALPSLELADADLLAEPAGGLDFVLQPREPVQPEPESDQDGLAALMAMAQASADEEAVAGAVAAEVKQPVVEPVDAPALPAVAQAESSDLSWEDVVVAASQAPESALAEPMALDQVALSTDERLPERTNVPVAPPPPVFTSISIDSLPSGVLGGGVGREPEQADSGLGWLSTLPKPEAPSLEQGQWKAEADLPLEPGVPVLDDALPVPEVAGVEPAIESQLAARPEIADVPLVDDELPVLEVVEPELAPELAEFDRKMAGDAVGSEAEIEPKLAAEAAHPEAVDIPVVDDELPVLEVVEPELAPESAEFDGQMVGDAVGFESEIEPKLAAEAAHPESVDIPVVDDELPVLEIVEPELAPELAEFDRQMAEDAAALSELEPAIEPQQAVQTIEPELAGIPVMDAELPVSDAAELQSVSESEDFASLTTENAVVELEDQTVPQAVAVPPEAEETLEQPMAPALSAPVPPEHVPSVLDGHAGEEDLPALSGLLGNKAASMHGAFEPLAAIEQPLQSAASMDAGPVSVVKIASMAAAGSVGRIQGAASPFDEQALFNSLYEQMLPRMKVELSLWLQEAVEVQAKQMLSGMMHQLKEDYEMLFGDALKESLRQALDDVGSSRKDEDGHG